MSTAVIADTIPEASPLTTANLAGAFYLSALLTEGAAAFVRWRLVVPGDATATAAGILAHEPLFRIASAAELIAMACLAAMMLLLHELLQPVARRVSALAAASGLAGCAVFGIASLFQIAALLVLRGAKYFDIPAVQPLPALALMCMNVRERIFSISLVLLGLYGLILGCLIVRSALLPQRAGALIALAGLGGLTFVSPVLAQHVSAYAVAAGVVGSVTLILSLLAAGQQRPEHDTAPSIGTHTRTVAPHPQNQRDALRRVS